LNSVHGGVVNQTMNVKLTDTQTAILKAAAGRHDGNIEPLPTNLRGGARAKVIDGLLARGLVEESEGSHLLTDAGYAVVGKQRPVRKGVRRMDASDALTKRETTAPTIRPGTKLAAVIQMLQRPDGTTIQQVMETTGWQAHTVRGTFAGALRKKLGLNIVSAKDATGERVYRIA
jgi:hypothetical protein